MVGVDKVPDEDDNDFYWIVNDSRLLHAKSESKVLLRFFISGPTDIVRPQVPLFTLGSHSCRQFRDTRNGCVHVKRRRDNIKKDTKSLYGRTDPTLLLLILPLRDLVYRGRHERSEVVRWSQTVVTFPAPQMKHLHEAGRNFKKHHRIEVPLSSTELNCVGQNQDPLFTKLEFKGSQTHRIHKKSGKQEM